MTSGTDDAVLGRYSHDVLVHDDDDQLVAGLRPFVEQGLETGGHVLVHSTEQRVKLLREAFGDRPRLTYGLDRDLYQSPMSTLFSYQRQLQTSPEPLELWATGTVPVGEDGRPHAAWTRYEALVNEALGSYAFHGLCSYDTRELPDETVAAARAAHPHEWAPGGRRVSATFSPPDRFLASELADVPPVPAGPPTARCTLQTCSDLGRTRTLLRRAVAPVSLDVDTGEGFVAAVNEVLANGLRHARPPVLLEVWVAPDEVVCRVTDHGDGAVSPVAGYRYPDAGGPMGLWVARQMCESLFIGRADGGGCAVMLSTSG